MTQSPFRVDCAPIVVLSGTGLSTIRFCHFTTILSVLHNAIFIPCVNQRKAGQLVPHQPPQSRKAGAGHGRHRQSGVGPWRLPLHASSAYGPNGTVRQPSEREEVDQQSTWRGFGGAPAQAQEGPPAEERATTGKSLRDLIVWGWFLVAFGRFCGAEAGSSPGTQSVQAIVSARNCTGTGRGHGGWL